MLYDKLGRTALRFAVLYVRHRYRRQLRVGTGVAAAAVGVALYVASRNVPEG